MYTLESFINDLYLCGEESQEGFFENIKEGAKSLWKRIKEIWSNFLDRVKRFFIKINPFISKQEKTIRCSRANWEECDNLKMRAEKISEEDFEILSVSEEAFNVGDDVFVSTNHNMNYKGDTYVTIGTSRLKSFLGSMAKTVEIMNKKVKDSLKKSTSDPNQGFFKKLFAHIKAFISTIIIPFRIIGSLFSTTISKGKITK